MTALIRVDGVTHRLLGPPCTPNISVLPMRGLPQVSHDRLSHLHAPGPAPPVCSVWRMTTEMYRDAWNDFTASG
jgi:hypothetical protein